jgi:hypothetical protein
MTALATVDSGSRQVQRPRDDLDFYVEPARAVEALLDVEDFPGRTWDPAVGIGTIPDVFHKRGAACWGSDIVDRGWRHWLTGDCPQFDFLRGGCCAGLPAPDNIVCNPPFKRAEEFIRHSLVMTTNKVAMLQRLSFLEGQRRRKLFLDTPLARVWVFSSRISMPPGGRGIEAKGGAVAFAWYVWQHGWRGPAQIGWLP